MVLPKLIKLPNQSKPFLVVMAPFSSRSGYGEHSKDIVRGLIKSDKYRIGLVSLGWGSTPLTLDPVLDSDIIKCLITNPETLNSNKPDIFIHITIPNEFNPVGKYNIGITAGIETTLCQPTWLEGINRMDKVIVPSAFSKEILQSAAYNVTDDNTQQKIGELRSTKPIEVLFEGTDTDVYKIISEIEYSKITNSIIKTDLDSVPEDFCFLILGQWLKGDFGHDRKDIASTILLFLKTFSNNKKKKTNPALVIKTGATFSEIELTSLQNKINDIKSTFPKDTKLPNIYLIYGDLSQTEMNILYNHPKIKALVSLTKGEGYGRPLQEFAFIGKPVIVTNCSGQVDFIKPDYHTLLGGQYQAVDPSAVDDFIIKESAWFQVDYTQFEHSLKDIVKNYKNYKTRASRGVSYLMKNKTLNQMNVKLIESVESKPILKTDLPQLPKLKLPELKNG